MILFEKFLKIEWMVILIEKKLVEEFLKIDYIMILFEKFLKIEWMVIFVEIEKKLLEKKLLEKKLLEKFLNIEDLEIEIFFQTKQEVVIHLVTILRF
jgi:hypothetical protein